MEYGTSRDIQGGTGAENAEITKSIFKGEQGARRNIILLNAGCGMYIGGKANSIADGVKLAAEMIDSGKALEMIDKLAKKTWSFA